MTPWAARLLRADLWGRCVRCGEPCPSGDCATCRTDQTDAQEARRAAYVAEGRCRCGRARAEGGEQVQCPECLLWDRERQRWRSLPAARDVEQGLMDRQLGLFDRQPTEEE